MKINKPYNIPGAHQLGKSSSKSGKVDALTSDNAQKPGVTLSGSANFVQTMREAASTFGVRTEVVLRAQQDIENQVLGSEMDYNQAVTALLVEL